MPELRWDRKLLIPTVSPSGRPMVPSPRNLWFSNCSVLVLFMIFFSSLYISTLTTDYGIIDDYSSLVKGSQGGRIKTIMVEGRLLHALGTSLYLQTARDIEDLRYARFGGIINISLLAWSIYQLFVRVGWNRFQSMCMGLLMCTTLPFQSYVAWATLALFPFAALVSGYALLLSDRAFQTRCRRLKWLLTAAAILLLLTALMIYQPAAMFFWVFAAIVLLKPETPLHDMLRRLGWYGLIASVGMFLGFAAYQLGPVLYPDLPSRTGLVQNFPIKIAWFLIEAFPNALLFTFLSPARWLLSDGSVPLSLFYRIVDIGIAWILFLIIVRGLVLYFQGPFKERLWKCSIAAALLTLSYTPNLVAAENWATYRTLSSLSSVVIVLMCLASRGYVRRLDFRLSPVCVNLGVGCITAFSAVLATYHVRTYFVVPQSRELAIMRDELMKKPLSQVHDISVIVSGKGDTLAPLRRYEFGRPSSSDTVTARYMAILLMREGGTEEIDLPVTAVAADAPPNPPPTALVVDMRTLGLLSPSGTKSSSYWETYRRYLNRFRGQATFGAP